MLYLEHLTQADLAFLTAAGSTAEPGELRAHPERLEQLIAAPAVYAALFRTGGQDALLHASPFLVFAVLVATAVRELGRVPFVEEWAGPRQRVPVFDVAGLQDFAANSLRRLFLAELLASYSRVASGSVWVQTARGWRRRRFSELDPLRLIELLDVVPDRDRTSVYRRLGDLSLFLTGVFPDYAGERMFAPVERERLQRALRRVGPADAAEPQDGSSGIWLLEQLGRRSYAVAWRATRASGAGRARVLGEVASGFGQARRILNFLTDRYLFPLREQWFSPST